MAANWRGCDVAFTVAPDESVNDELASGEKETRVWMPETAEAGSGLLLPIQPLDGLVSFLFRLIHAAKDWQDSLQSTLAGYRDRIVHVYLKPTEGGLNIVMPNALVSALGEYGAQAGEMLRDRFSLDEHRWRRFLVAMDRLHESLENFLDAYAGHAGGPESFSAFLSRVPERTRSYKQTLKDLALLQKRAGELAALADSWRNQQQIPQDRLPHPKTDLRITPKP